MNKDLYDLFGIVAVLNTPFTLEDGLDLEGLARHVAYAIECGVVGFLVPAMASEVYKLSEKERLQMVSTVLEINNNRVKVIGGAGELNSENRIRIVKDLLKLGCSDILLQIPFSSEDRFRDEVFRIADLNPNMIMIQDWDFEGAGLPVPLICRLFEEVESFRCLKIETVPAGPKYSEVLDATGGYLHVSGGWAVSTMIEALERGAHAFMPTGLYEIYCLIYRLFRDGKLPEATEWFNRILPILSFANQHLDISIHFFKRLLHAQGIYKTYKVREPILPFDKIHESRTEILIDSAMKLMKKAKKRRQVY
jgi:4-hydroxy-tetrahydrodipicolinate synthase